jgi:hypothetical protein
MRLARKRKSDRGQPSYARIIDFKQGTVRSPAIDVLRR